MGKSTTKTEKSFIILYTSTNTGEPTYEAKSTEAEARSAVEDLLGEGEADPDETIEILEVVRTLTRKIVWE